MRRFPPADRWRSPRPLSLPVFAIAFGLAHAAAAQVAPTSATQPTGRASAPTAPTTEVVSQYRALRSDPTHFGLSILADPRYPPLQPWAQPALLPQGSQLTRRGAARLRAMTLAGRSQPQPAGALSSPAWRLAVLELFGPASGADIDRIAFAVDGAESSHGANPRMWRPEPSGPQGPMQVSAAAATDVGGGNRFDEFENRMLGRAYLAHLFRRFGNWSDAIAAYNWGPGNLESWIGAGRPAAGLPLGVEHYLDRVLHDAALRQTGLGFAALAVPAVTPVRPRPTAARAAPALPEVRHGTDASVLDAALGGPSIGATTASD